MMTLEFKKYEPKAEWETLGTVKQMAGKGGKIGFIKRNLRDTAKNVCVLITKADGTSTTVSCHKDLSPKVRSGEIKLNQLAGLHIIGVEDVRLIVLPGTGGTQSFEVDKIKEVAVVEESGDFVPEELIAF